MIREVTIAQTPDGWLWKEYGRTYKSAVNAFAAVTRDDKRRLKAGSFAGSIITWEPLTVAGTIAVRALGARPD